MHFFYLFLWFIVVIMIESEIQRQIIDYLESFGHMVYRMNAGKGRYNIRLSPAGTPDLLVIMDNSSVWIEVKQPGKVPTDVQLEQYNRLMAKGQVVIVCTSVDDVKKGLM